MIIKENIVLANINKMETLRYLGIKNGQADENTIKLIDVCESELLATVSPKVVYSEFELVRNDRGLQVKDTILTLEGKDIHKHLRNCSKVILMCATLSESVDKLIRLYQIKDLSRAVVFDSLASVAIDEVCDIATEHIKDKFPKYYLTWRYGIGYGDLSLDIAHTFLEVLNTNKEIGLYVNENNILLPKKSIVCIIGLSESEILQNKKSCINCKLKDRCAYRKKGERCGF